MAECGVQGLSREQTFKGRHRAAKLFVFSSDLTQPKLPRIRTSAFRQIQNSCIAIISTLANAVIAHARFAVHAEIIPEAQLDMHVR